MALLPESERAELLAGLTDAEAANLEYDWSFWARTDQIAPLGQWATWIALAGRGWGKTEAGAQWIRQRVKDGAKSIALIAETQKDLEEVMVERLVSCHPPDEAPVVRFKPVRLRWPNGAVALGYNGTEPNQLRGPQFDTAWVDELAKYRYAAEAWDMLQFTMRRGNDPRVFVTTTPRPIKTIRDILNDPTTRITRGSTFDNATNLPAQFLDRLRAKYEGTRLGRQELNAEILDDVPGALWQRNNILFAPTKPDMRRVVVAIDPATTSGEDSDETGIVVAAKGVDGRGYVLADLTCRESPNEWARIAVQAFHDYKADRIVAETNQGGEMVEATIRTVASRVPFTGIHAKRGKVLRAEPVAALYEQQRVSHVGSFYALEDQMCAFTPDFDPKSAGYSPDRVDALVYALTELLVEQENRPTRSLNLNFMGR
ncbi:terminase large subunit domain-containing protein [Acidiphilium sp.]|uniref:DNA-packaging protein n=1 Tax=Acidiphilium sp. TaxID=527 RepID=UPI002BF6D4D1|nr:terminase family protein [Acidiphilium sp.]HQT62556.1 terminase family protein [Acidiphilium sp.]